MELRAEFLPAFQLNRHRDNDDTGGDDNDNYNDDGVRLDPRDVTTPAGDTLGNGENSEDNTRDGWYFYGV